MERPAGLRERKKAATRRAIGDAAVRLFCERGFDVVTVREVAEAADVSVTTVFNYYPSKEALVFDHYNEHERRSFEAVRTRPPEVSVAQALRQHFLSVTDSSTAEGSDAYRALIKKTPRLMEYAWQLSLRSKTSLAAVLAQEVNLPEDDPLCLALASFALDIWALSDARRNPRPIIESGFDLIEKGWEPALSVRNAGHESVGGR